MSQRDNGKTFFCHLVVVLVVVFELGDCFVLRSIYHTKPTNHLRWFSPEKDFSTLQRSRIYFPFSNLFVLSAFYRNTASFCQDFVAQWWNICFV